MTRSNAFLLAARAVSVSTLLALASTSVACGTEVPDEESGTQMSGTSSMDSGADQGTAGTDNDAVACLPVDTSTCIPRSTDFKPGLEDGYPACVVDDGQYHLIATTPGSVGRVQAYDQIADLLWSFGVPGAEAFKQARMVYETPEGLKSRLERREDLHYPGVPEADWDPGVDPDKQCSVAANVQKYPQRCAGPALINPLITQAFLDGANAVGDAAAHAATIEAAGLWFLYLSVYKEAFTCTAKAKDCDSSWAYYTGGAQRDGALLGLAEQVALHSPTAHQHIFDGILAVRCFRDIYPNEQYPSLDTVPAQGRALFDLAWQQLDDALHFGFAEIVRARLRLQLQCMEAIDSSPGTRSALGAFLRVVGPVLDREAAERDATLAAELSAIWSSLDDVAGPDEAVSTRALELLDALFPCPAS